MRLFWASWLPKIIIYINIVDVASEIFGTKGSEKVKTILFLDFKPEKLFSIALTVPQIMMAEMHETYECRIVYSSYTEAQCEEIYKNSTLADHPSCMSINGTLRWVYKFQ